MNTQLTLALRQQDGFLFENYIAGPNQAAVAAVAAWARGELEQVYIYGPEGSGRSHLLSAASKTAEDSGLNLCLLPSKELLQMPAEVLEGIEQYSLIAVDDVDSFVGLPEWQEALFHLYNRCRELGHHMLFTANAKPRNLGLALADLVSRLGAGPVYQLQALGDADLVELLQCRAKQRGLPMSDEVAAYIIHRGVRAPNALVLLLDTLDEKAMVEQRKLTIPFVREVLEW